MSRVSIDTMIASLRGLGEGLSEEIAKEAAPGILRAVQETAAAGTSPTGEAWRAKKDGSPALANASKAISARVLGSIVQLQLEFPFAIWNNMPGGATRPRRRILPESGELPASITDAIEAATNRVLARRAGR